MTVSDRLWHWAGPGGVCPPFPEVAAPTLDRDLAQAARTWREALARIAADPAPPSFENSIVALESCRQDFDRVHALLQLYVTTASTPEIAELDARWAAEISRTEDEAYSAALFERVATVRDAPATAGRDAQDRRLVELVHRRFVTRGAGLDPAGRARLGEIHAALAGAAARFRRNVADEERQLCVLVDDAGALDGIDADLRDAAARLAAERGHAGLWLIAMQRPTVMAVLTGATDRGLRERVWRCWSARCDTAGPNDNRPVMADILRLRGEKARLLGYSDFAHFAMTDRMLAGPEDAARLLHAVWERVHPLTEAQIADLQKLADADGIGGPIETWVRYFYAEKLRRTRFGASAEALRPYLAADGVIAACLEAAAQLHGLRFVPRPDIATHHPDVRAYAVEREGVPIGMLHFDVIARPEKRGGSWMQPLQAVSTLGSGSLPVCVVITSIGASEADAMPRTTWSHVVVLFHELGHALHALLARTAYPSTGFMAVSWDAIELPALLNERWAEDMALLGRHLRHWRSGEPIPGELVEAALAAARHDRVFSVSLDYLVGAIIDLELHTATDGAIPDITEVERRTLAELGMPRAADQIMRPPHFFHLSSEDYAAGVYAYLLGDVMAAQVAEAFLDAPGGLYDAEVARRWRDTLLTIGAREPVEAAWRRFSGTDPDPAALLRRFGMAA
jgi:peptidyl-dipeptidase Dcp